MNICNVVVCINKWIFLTSQATNILVITFGSLMSLPPLRITCVCTLASLYREKITLDI